MTKRYLHLLTVLLLLPAVCFGDKFDKAVNSANRDKKLQASFLEFPLLTSTNEQGELAFQTLELDHPVKIGGVNFYGFRFKVPEREGKQDLVWSFIENGFCTWYILPQTGVMNGFANYYYEPRTRYEDVEDLFPVNGKDLVTQRLAGDSLEDGKDYVIWFAFRSHKPASLSLKFTFAHLPPKKIRNGVPLEKVLGLHRK